MNADLHSWRAGLTFLRFFMPDGARPGRYVPRSRPRSAFWPEQVLRARFGKEVVLADVAVVPRPPSPEALMFVAALEQRLARTHAARARHYMRPHYHRPTAARWTSPR